MATQKQWDVMKEWDECMSPIGATLLELRARVEALESKLASPPSIIVPSISDEHLETLKQPGRFEVLEPGDQMVAPAPTGGLVERVARAIEAEPYQLPRQGNRYSPEARAAIRAVAVAARARDLGGQSVIVVTWAGVARWLEEEAGR